MYGGLPVQTSSQASAGVPTTIGLDSNCYPPVSYTEGRPIINGWNLGYCGRTPTLSTSNGQIPGCPEGTTTTTGIGKPCWCFDDNGEKDPFIEIDFCPEVTPMVAAAWPGCEAYHADPWQVGLDTIMAIKETNQDCFNAITCPAVSLGSPAQIPWLLNYKVNVKTCVTATTSVDIPGVPMLDALGTAAGYHPYVEGAVTILWILRMTGLVYHARNENEVYEHVYEPLQTI